MSRYDDVTATLKALGLILSMRPGEYCIRRRGGTDAGYVTDDLDDALAYGRAAGSELRSAEPQPVKGQRTGPQGPMNAKAMRRRFIRRHNRRQQRRTLKRRETS